MNTAPSIHYVAWYGVSVHLVPPLLCNELSTFLDWPGLQILHHLASTYKFTITLLVRREPASYRELPNNIAIKQIDLSSRSSLVHALIGNDAMVVFTSMAPYHDMDSVQLALINASIEAGVKFFVPSEWGPDTAGGNGATTFRIGPNTLPPTPIIGMKRAMHDYLLARSGEGKIDFATLHTGNMLLSRFLLRRLLCHS